MALNTGSLICADVPLWNCSLTHTWSEPLSELPMSLTIDVNMNGQPWWRFVFSECFLVVIIVILVSVVCGCWQS